MKITLHLEKTILALDVNIATQFIVVFPGQRFEIYSFFILILELRYSKFKRNLNVTLCVLEKTILALCLRCQYFDLSILVFPGTEFGKYIAPIINLIFRAALLKMHKEQNFRLKVLERTILALSSKRRNSYLISSFFQDLSFKKTYCIF